jgi:hypothetical protein
MVVLQPDRGRYLWLASNTASHRAMFADKQMTRSTSALHQPPLSQSRKSTGRLATQNLALSCHYCGLFRLHLIRRTRDTRAGVFCHAAIGCLSEHSSSSSSSVPTPHNPNLSVLTAVIATLCVDCAWSLDREEKASSCLSRELRASKHQLWFTLVTNRGATPNTHRYDLHLQSVGSIN